MYLEGIPVKSGVYKEWLAYPEWAGRFKENCRLRRKKM